MATLISLCVFYPHRHATSIWGIRPMCLLLWIISIVCLGLEGPLSSQPSLLVLNDPENHRELWFSLRSR